MPKTESEATPDIEKMKKNLSAVEENYFLMLNLIKKFTYYSEVEDATMFRFKVEGECQALLEEIDSTWPKLDKA